MKGLFATILLGGLIAAPVAAQIAGSGQPTDDDLHLLQAEKPAPVPASSPRAEPKLASALAGGYRSSPLLKVDISSAKRLGRRSGIRVISGSRVTVVTPGVRRLRPSTRMPERTPQMKLIRVGTGPRASATRYGANIIQPHGDERTRPATIRINP